MKVKMYVDWNEKFIMTENEYLEMVQREIDEELEDRNSFADFCDEQLDNSENHFSKYELLTFEECQKTAVLEKLKKEYKETIEENVKEDLKWKWEEYHFDI